METNALDVLLARFCRLLDAAMVLLLALMESATWALFLPVIVLVGLKFGVFTPTEAAVVAAIYGLFVATVVYRELKLHDASCRTQMAVMFLLVFLRRW
jgi:TRAP-type transport system large permease protein